MGQVNPSGLPDNDYNIPDRLKEKWDKIKDGKLKKKDSDRVFIVDGRERTGKSVWTLQQACYIDPSLIGDLSRICFTAEEFLEAIRKTDSTLTQTRCVIFDEAFRGLSSRAATSKVNKKILQALMEVGQKNLVIWIVLPSFFMLDLYPAMLRSNALFHIKQDKRSSGRGFYVYSYRKKAKLYQIGVRKGWGYFPSRFFGRFSKCFPGGEAFEKAYRAKKHKALVESETARDIPEEKTRDELLLAIMLKKDRERRGISQEKQAEELRKLGIRVKQELISYKERKVTKLLKEDDPNVRFLKEKSEIISD